MIGRVVATASWWRVRRPAETALLPAASVLARRTFFRYFESKEDVLFRAIDAFGDRVAGAAHVRPAEEPVWNAIRASQIVRVRQRAWSHVLEHPMGSQIETSFVIGMPPYDAEGVPGLLE